MSPITPLSASHRCIAARLLHQDTPEPAASVARLIDEHILAFAGPSVAHDKDVFRRDVLYKTDVHLYFKLHMRRVRAMFASICPLRKASTVRSKYVSIREWVKLLSDGQVIDDHFTVREAKLCFVWARMRCVEELRRLERNQGATFVDFMEALARVAYMKWLPSDAAIEEAGLEKGDAFTFLRDNWKERLGIADTNEDVAHRQVHGTFGPLDRVKRRVAAVNAFNDAGRRRIGDDDAAYGSESGGGGGGGGDGGGVTMARAVAAIDLGDALSSGSPVDGTAADAEGERAGGATGDGDGSGSGARGDSGGKAEGQGRDDTASGHDDRDGAGSKGSHSGADSGGEASYDSDSSIDEEETAMREGGLGPRIHKLLQIIDRGLVETEELREREQGKEKNVLDR